MNATEQCDHDDCARTLEPGETCGGWRGRFCSTEHHLAAANGKRLDDDGGVIEPNKGPMPSKSGNDVSVVVPLFDCPYCGDDSERVAREYGEWVHQTCGEKVTDGTAQTANELLEDGEIDRGFVEHQARSTAQLVSAQLEEKDCKDSTGTQYERSDE